MKNHFKGCRPSNNTGTNSNNNNNHKDQKQAASAAAMPPPPPRHPAQAPAAAHHPAQAPAVPAAPRTAGVFQRYSSTGTQVSGAGTGGTSLGYATAAAQGYVGCRD